MRTFQFSLVPNMAGGFPKDLPVECVDITATIRATTEAEATDWLKNVFGSGLVSSAWTVHCLDVTEAPDWSGSVDDWSSCIELLRQASGVVAQLSGTPFDQGQLRGLRAAIAKAEAVLA